MTSRSFFTRFCAVMGDVSAEEVTVPFRLSGRPLRHGVIAAAAPGMTAGQTADGKPEPLQRTVLAQRLEGILRAGGREAARRRGEGRNAELVEAHEHDQRQDADPLTDVQQPFPESGGLHG